MAQHLEPLQLPCPSSGEIARLLTRYGDTVATLFMPPMAPQPEIIVFGSRHFVRSLDGKYREGRMWVAERSNIRSVTHAFGKRRDPHRSLPLVA